MFTEVLNTAYVLIDKYVLICLIKMLYVVLAGLQIAELRVTKAWNDMVACSCTKSTAKMRTLHGLEDLKGHDVINNTSKNVHSSARLMIQQNSEVSICTVSKLLLEFEIEVCSKVSVYYCMLVKWDSFTCSDVKSTKTTS